MDTQTTCSLLVFLATCGLTVLGDYFLKSSTQSEQTVVWLPLVSGCLLYGITGFGWAFSMRHMKLASLGVAFSVITTTFVGLLGWWVFNETLSSRECVGIGLGLAALVLLAE